MTKLTFIKITILHPFHKRLFINLTSFSGTCVMFVTTYLKIEKFLINLVQQLRINNTIFSTMAIESIIIATKRDIYL